MIRAFFRYGLTGALATAVHYAVLIVCVEVFRWPAFIGAGIGAIVGAQVAFFGNRRFTFAHAGAIAPAWAKFQGTAGVGAVLGMAVVALGVQWGWHYLVAQVLATLLSMVLTFAINRAWTFR